MKKIESNTLLSILIFLFTLVSVFYFNNETNAQSNQQSNVASSVYLGTKIDRIAKQLAELEKEFFNELSSGKRGKSENTNNSELAINQQKKIDILEKSLKNLRGFVEEEFQSFNKTINDTTQKISSLNSVPSSENSISNNDVNKINNNLILLNEEIIKLNSKINTTINFIGNAEARIIRIESLLNAGLNPSNNFKNLQSNDTNLENNLNNLDNNVSTLSGDTSEVSVDISQDNLGDGSGTLGLLEVQDNTNDEVIESQTTKKPNILPQGSPDEQFKFALELALKRKFRDAEIALKEFMEVNPTSEKIQDAHYWYGAVLFKQEKYEDSAMSDLDFNGKYPEDSRIIETTLRIAEAISAVASTEQACQVFENSLVFITDPPERFVNKINELKADKACD